MWLVGFQMSNSRQPLSCTNLWKAWRTGVLSLLMMSVTCLGWSLFVLAEWIPWIWFPQDTESTVRNHSSHRPRQQQLHFADDDSDFSGAEFSPRSFVSNNDYYHSEDEQVSNLTLKQKLSLGHGQSSKNSFVDCVARLRDLFRHLPTELLRLLHTTSNLDLQRNLLACCNRLSMSCTHDDIAVLEIDASFVFLQPGGQAEHCDGAGNKVNNLCNGKCNLFEWFSDLVTAGRSGFPLTHLNMTRWTLLSTKSKWRQW